LEAAVEVGRTAETEPLQARGSQARRVPLVAKEDDDAVGARGLRDSIGRRGVKPPLENVPVDHDRARELPIAAAQLAGPDVDDERPTGDKGWQLGRGRPMREPAARLRQRLVDPGGTIFHGTECRAPHGRP
jgi:hypothetical protein